MNIIKFIAWMILWILSAGIGFCVDDEDSQSSSEPTEEEQTFVDLQTVLFGTLPIVPESLNDQVEPPEDVQVTAFGAEGEEPPRKRQARESSTGAVVPVPFSRNLPPPEPTDASFDINGLIRRIMHRMHPEGDVGGEMQLYYMSGSFVHEYNTLHIGLCIAYCTPCKSFGNGIKYLRNSKISGHEGFQLLPWYRRSSAERGHITNDHFRKLCEVLAIREDDALGGCREGMVIITSKIIVLFRIFLGQIKSNKNSVFKSENFIRGCLSVLSKDFKKEECLSFHKELLALHFSYLSKEDEQKFLNSALNARGTCKPPEITEKYPGDRGGGSGGGSEGMLPAFTSQYSIVALGQSFGQSSYSASGSSHQSASKSNGFALMEFIENIYNDPLVSAIILLSEAHAFTGLTFLAFRGSCQ